jgi:hypothetical protein
MNYKYYEIVNDKIQQSSTRHFTSNNTNFNKYSNLSASFNIVGSEHIPTANIIIYSKRELEAPILQIIYFDKSTTERSSTQLELTLSNHFQATYNTPKNIKVSSINLNNIFNVCETKFNLVIETQAIRFNSLKVALDIYVRLKNNHQQSSVNFFKFSINNIVTLKQSILQFIKNLQSINEYNTTIVSKNYILLNKLGYRKLRNKNAGLSALLNEKQLTSIDAVEFVKFYNSKCWLDEVDKFKQLISDRIVVLDKSRPVSKSINIKGLRFFIQKCIDIKFPISISNSNMNWDQQLEFAYVLLRYYDKYDMLISALSLVKLKTLSQNG